MIQIAGKGALVLVWFLAVPFCLGLPFQIGRKKEDCRFIYTMLAGAGTMMGLFELLAVPMILTKQSYSRLILIYGVLLGALSVLGLALGRGQILAVSVERIKVFRHLPWTGVAAGVLILVQAAAYVAGMMTDLDDSLYRKRSELPSGQILFVSFSHAFGIFKLCYRIFSQRHGPYH